MRIYYTTDLHGSEKCWRKFLATPKYYQASIIIVGGDITGKFIVPIIQLSNGRFEATYMGKKHNIKKEKDVEQLIQLISYSGQYAVRMTQNEYNQYEEKPEMVDGLFKKMILERVKQWMNLAEEKLQGSNIRCFVSAGNDDRFEVDDVIASSKLVENHDGKVVNLGEGIELLGLGYSNITPWNCPRDITEDELNARIERIAIQVRRPDRAIFNIHVPPYDTGIDEAPELTEDMRMMIDPVGQPKKIPVGSTAVRQAILKYQPMLSLHGHIHESSGIRRLGNTTIVNPGSEYGEGILRGAVIDIDGQKGIANVNIVIG